jgi:hypothetical protein
MDTQDLEIYWDRTSTNSGKVKNSRDYAGAFYSAEGKRLLQGCEDYTRYFEFSVENGTEVICDGAFRQLYVLGRVLLPSTVKHIGYYAFGFCESLGEINRQLSIIKTDKYAFDGSKLLNRINIPKGAREKFEQLLDKNCYHMLNKE